MREVGAEPRHWASRSEDSTKVDRFAAAATGPRPKLLRSSPRLKTFDYLGHYAYHFGSKTRGDLPLFRDDRTALDTIEALQKACAKCCFTLLAYTIMPNHVHVLAHSESGSSGKEFMRYFKQLAGFAYRKPTGDSLWQISFYDHILRSDEAIGRLGEYIWNNPVRARIVERPEDYPYNGPREYME
jgi:putative transposase